jgi:hypothetical protein
LGRFILFAEKCHRTVVDIAILLQRHALYCQASERNPRRWSGKTRNWTPVGTVTFNPERDAVVNTHLSAIDRRPSVPACALANPSVASNVSPQASSTHTSSSSITGK